MPAMHEDVHQGAGEQEEKRQSRQDVRSVFGDEIIADHDKKRDHQDAHDP